MSVWIDVEEMVYLAWPKKNGKSKKLIQIVFSAKTGGDQQKPGEISGYISKHSTNVEPLVGEHLKGAANWSLLVLKVVARSKKQIQ